MILSNKSASACHRLEAVTSTRASGAVIIFSCIPAFGSARVRTTWPHGMTTDIRTRRDNKKKAYDGSRKDIKRQAPKPKGQPATPGRSRGSVCKRIPTPNCNEERWMRASGSKPAIHLLRCSIVVEAVAVCEQSAAFISHTKAWEMG